MFTEIAVEIWEEDFIASHVWVVDTEGYSVNYEHLRPQKRFGVFDYLKLLWKLLPFGQVWRFPLGEPGDY